VKCEVAVGRSFTDASHAQLHVKRILSPCKNSVISWVFKGAGQWASWLKLHCPWLAFRRCLVWILIGVPTLLTVVCVGIICLFGQFLTQYLKVAHSLSLLTGNELRGLSSRANCTDWATAACRRS
jgi:hypothetical protein